MQDKIQFIPDEDLRVVSVPFAALSQTQNWGMSLVGIQDIWEVSKQGEGIKVAILDTGFSEHPDLIDAWKESEAVNCTSDAKVIDEGSGHGVHVAGIISGSDNDFGVVGVAPKAKCYAIKVLDNSGSGSYDSIANGLRKAIDLEVDIINMSLGAPSEPPSHIHDLIKEAVSKGIIVVAAAGNDAHAVNYPARYDEVIAVAALDESGSLATFTSKDFTVDIVAPGTNIYSTHLNGNYCKMSGTSQASPFVAGICALIKSALKNQNLLPEFGNLFCQEDMMTALKNISTKQNYNVQPGDEQNWGPGVPKLANIDWNTITVKKS
jgi:subtilisin